MTGSKRLLIVVLLIALLQVVFLAPAFASGEDEKELLALVNKERVSRGLPILKVDPHMVILAREHSQEMVELNYFEHTSPISGDLLERVEASGYTGWKVVGENLAAAPTVRTAFAALMNSPGHRENILNEEFTHVGIGAVQSRMYGKMFTQEFVGREKVEFARSLKVVPTPAGTRLSFELLRPGLVAVTVHDLTGNRLATISRERLRRPGPIELEWRGRVTADGTDEVFEYRVSFENANFSGSVSEVASVGQDQLVVARPTFSFVLFLQSLFEKIL